MKSEETDVHELIYRFLLEAGFSRASLVSLSAPVGASSDEASPEAQSYQPWYRVNDPETASPLAVIDVVESDAASAVTRRCKAAWQYAASSGDAPTQVYLIQLRSGSASVAERVQFYQALSSDQTRPLSAYEFPDLDTLRANRVRSSVYQQQRAATELSNQPDVSQERTSGVGRVYFLAILLLLSGAVDWWLQHNRGEGLFSLTQALLVVTAAVLFAAPVLVRRLRDPSSKR